MGVNDDLSRKIQDVERERQRQERKEKWDKREKRFWKTFLFTEDGKPKSGFGIYTFCLSFVFLVLDAVIFGLVIDALTGPMASWPPVLSNLVQSLAASVLALLAPWVMHRLSKDKRLAFGSHLWIAGYALVVLIAMLVILRGTGAVSAFLVFYLWFVLIPLAVTLLGTGLLCRRDHHPAAPAPAEPAWRKYTKRR